MIKIMTSVDSLENNPDAITFTCTWEIISEMTENEEYAASKIVGSIQEAFDDLSANALINGGSVQRTFKKGEDEKE